MMTCKSNTGWPFVAENRVLHAVLVFLGSLFVGFYPGFNSTAQSQEIPAYFYANPTRAMQAADPKAKPLVILFCDREEEDCSWVWQLLDRHSEYWAGHFTWAVVFVNDFDGRIWADRYEVSETPGLWLQQDSTLISPLLSEHWGEIFILEKLSETPGATSGEIGETSDPEWSDGHKLSSTTPREEKVNEIIPNITEPVEVGDHSAVAPGFYRVVTERIIASGFTIQVANFGTYAELLYYTERVSGILDTEVITEIVRDDGGIRYKVLLGLYPTREEATAERQKLNAMGIEGFIRKIN